MNHMKLTFVKLADWVEGQLSTEEATRVEDAVVKAATETQESVAWLRAFQHLTEEFVLDTPPEHVRRALHRRFGARAQATPSEETGRDTPPHLITAILSFDSAQAPVPAGARSAISQGQERQLVYTSELADVALNVHPRRQNQRLDLMGQVLPLEENASLFYSVQLLGEEAEAGLTVTDELGEFDFEAILPGTYRLIFSSDDVELTLPLVDLRA